MQGWRLKLNLSNPTAYALGFFVVCFLFYHMALAKVATLHSLSQFDPKDETGLFWTESAFHYRYAKLAAEGSGIPEIDTAMQYPEGMHVLRDEMPMMERFAGLAYRYRARPGAPFHVFLLTLVCFYSSLLVFPAYFLSAYLWRNALGGVLTTAFYVLTYSFIGNVVLGGYVRQDFALPFLFLATCFLLVAMDRGVLWAALSGTGLLLFSFMSWHLSQFYYLVFLAGVLLCYFFRAEARGNIAKTVLVVTAVAVPLSLFYLPLRSGFFPASLSMIAGYALLIQHGVLRRRFPTVWQRILLFAVLFVVMAGAVMLVAGEHYTRYSHVYRLMIDKLRFLGVKPGDPSRLSFESRLMWTSSFLSPPLNVMAGWLSGAWIAGAVGAVLAVRSLLTGKGRPVSERIILWMAGVFIVLFALIQRMDVFAAFFVCVLAGGIIPAVLLSRRGLAAIAGAGLLLWLSFWTMSSLYMISSAPPADKTRPLYEQIRKNTASNEVILALFQFSPGICAYTERPVVVHSKFENERVREKVREFYAALYEDEETFYEYCRKYDVSYFIYEPSMLLSQSKESLRYSVDQLALDDRSTVVLMHFLPEALRRFGLSWQSPAYRVYKVLDAPREPGPLPFEKLPVYDSHRYRREDLGLEEG